MAASARINFDRTKVAGGQHIGNFANYQLLAIQELARGYAVAVQVTANGTTALNLEGSSEFGVGAGQGAAFQAALLSCNGAIATLQAAIGTILAQLDQS